MSKALKNPPWVLVGEFLILAFVFIPHAISQQVLKVNTYDNPIQREIIGFKVVSENNVFAFTRTSIFHFNGKKWRPVFHAYNSLIKSIDADGENIVFNMEPLAEEYYIPSIYLAKFQDDTIKYIAPLKIPFTHEALSIKFISVGKCLIGGLYEYAFVRLRSNSISYKIFNFDRRDSRFSFNIFPYPYDLNFIPFHNSYSIFYLRLKSGGGLNKNFDGVLNGTQHPVLERLDFETTTVISSLEFINLPKKDVNSEPIEIIVNFENNGFGLLRQDSSGLNFEIPEQVTVRIPIHSIFKTRVGHTNLTNKSFVKVVCLNSVNPVILGLTKSGEILRAIDENLKEWEVLVSDYVIRDIIPISGDSFFAFSNTKVFKFVIDFKSDGDGNYREIEQKSNILFGHYPFGAGEFFGICADDFDDDGFDDVYLLNVSNIGNYYKGSDLDSNEILNLSSKFGLSGRTRGSVGVASADINNDGDIDVLATGIYGNSDIFVNKKGYFRNMSSEYGLSSLNTKRSEHIALADVNSDGWIDVLITSFSGSNRLLINLNGKKFVDFTEKAGLVSDGRTICASFCDINGDGYLDLYIGNWTGGNKMYLNNGDGTFKDFTEESGTGGDVLMKTNSVLFADFNNDGYPELFVGNRGNGNLFFINDEMGRFKNVTRESGLLDSSLFTYGCTANDFDNDGLLDLFIVYLGGVKIYKNLGAKENSIPYFADVTSEYIGLSERLKGYNTCCVSFDIDNDGDIDLVFTRYVNGSINILRNYLNDRIEARKNYVKVKLIGVRANYNCIGAVVKLFKDGELVGTRYVTAGSGYASSESKIIHFGLPDEYGDYEIQVEFPLNKGDRIVKRVKVKPGEFITVKEIEGIRASFIEFSRLIGKLMQPDRGELIKLLIVVVVSFVYFSLVYLLRKVYSTSLKVIGISVLCYFVARICIYFFHERQPYVWSLSGKNWFVEDVSPLLIFGLAILISHSIFREKEIVDVAKEEVISGLIERLGEFEHSSVKTSILTRISLITQNITSVDSNETALELEKRLLELVDQYKNLILPSLRYISELCEVLGIQFNFKFAVQIDDKLNEFIRKFKSNEASVKQLAFQISRDISNLVKEITNLRKKVISSYTTVVESVIESVIRSFNVNYIYFNSSGGTEVIFNEKELFNVISAFVENSIQALCGVEAEPRIDIKLVENEDVEIHIIDNGPGISKEQMENMFKFKNTTKPSGHGFGHRYAGKYVKKYGGRIEVISENKGCHFVIKLKKAITLGR